MEIIVRKSTMVFMCCCVVGCQSGLEKGPPTFEERQEQLFHKVDHKLIYQSCQELMRLHRGGKLSRTTFYSDDPEAEQSELPEAVRSLRATYVRVDEVMVDIDFHSEDGTQLLMCFSDEFGEPLSRGEESKGLGFRSDPFDMDKLSGTESLDYLNENYDHFQMELIPGLTYERYTAEQTDPPEDIRQSNEMMDMFTDFMNESIKELAVKKQKLLYQTNYDELLKASRRVITRYNEGTYSKAKINMIDGSPEDIKRIPKIILDLKPVYVWLEKRRAIVALIGGLDHAGVYAYANNEEAVLHNDTMKLIDGLVYYDDGLREVGDEYKDYLKNLEDEAIPYLDWKRKKMNLPIPKRNNVQIQGVSQ